MSYPEGVPASVPNLYAYAAGSPVTLSDPSGHNACEPDKSILAGPGDPMAVAAPDLGCPDPDKDDDYVCLFGGCEEESDSETEDSEQGQSESPGDRSGGWKRTKPRKPVCDAACQWRNKVEKRDRAKGRWDEYYDEHRIPLPPGIDDPACPRGNAMCNGTPSKPSGVISDQQGIDNQGLADRINKSAGTSGSRVLGRTTKAGDESIFDRIGTDSGLGDGSRSTRHDPGGGDTPMTMEELWKFLKENKIEIGHTVLDLLGLIPLIGEIADIGNAAWYAAQGEFKMAGISLASTVPFLGWGGTGAKLGAKYGDEAADAIGAANSADEVLKISKPYSRPSGATTRAQRQAVQG